MKYSITKNGVPLDKSLYTMDEETKTFSTNESGLVLDFRNVDYCTFKTGSDCTFKTNSYCTFNTGSDCTFNTGLDCTFNTGSDCTFNTGSDCTFNTGSDCVVVRRDIYEVIELKEGVKIKLKGLCIKGFTLVDTPKETITIGGVTYLKEEVENALKDIKSV